MLYNKIKEIWVTGQGKCCTIRLFFMGSVECSSTKSLSTVSVKK